MNFKPIPLVVSGMLLAPLTLASEKSDIQELKEQVNALAQKVDDTNVRKKSKTTIGGYGELHYNNLRTTETGKPASTKQEIDFHRFVLFFGHEYNDKLRFFSEVEIEHGNTEANGAVELEQAYIEADLSQKISGRAGLMLAPVGILNETHEPPTFYGVERNPVEKNIIPTTWWNGGVSIHGHNDFGLSYDIMLSEGLYAADGYSIRSARQSTSKAKAKNLAYTGRLKYTGTPGLTLSISARYETDLGQGTLSSKAPAVLTETHAIYQKNKFGLRALYAQWNISGNSAKLANADIQKGYYIEPSYQLNQKVGIFGRYNNWQNKSGNKNQNRQYDLGFSYKPHPDVVFKADYQWYTQDTKKTNGFNLGVGYQF